VQSIPEITLFTQRPNSDVTELYSFAKNAFRQFRLLYKLVYTSTGPKLHSYSDFYILRCSAQYCCLNKILSSISQYFGIHFPSVRRSMVLIGSFNMKIATTQSLRVLER